MALAVVSGHELDEHLWPTGDDPSWQAEVGVHALAPLGRLRHLTGSKIPAVPMAVHRARRLFPFIPSGGCHCGQRDV